MLLDKADSIQADIKTTEHGSERERRLNRGVSKIVAEINQLDEREAVLKAERNVEIQAGLKSGKYTVERGDGFDLDRDPMRDHRDQTPVYTGNDPWDSLEEGVLGRHTSVNEAKSRALSAVELSAGLTDASRTKATGILEDQDPDGVVSRYCLATSDPDYVSAFSQMMRDPQALLTDSEIRAVRRVKEFARAMSLTDSEGGFLVPFQLDPTVIQTDDLGVSDIRRISRKVIATGDVWNGVSSGAVSWSWDVEASQVSDDATTFAQPAITIHKAAGFVPISIEALQDEQNVTETISTLLVDGRNDLEGTALGARHRLRSAFRDCCCGHSRGDSFRCDGYVRPRRRQRRLGRVAGQVSEQRHMVGEPADLQPDPTVRCGRFPGAVHHLTGGGTADKTADEQLELHGWNHYGACDQPGAHRRRLQPLRHSGSDRNGRRDDSHAFRHG